MTPEAERLVYAEERRHLAAVVAIVDRFPEYRAHLCHALLASAIATCDTFGVDVEAFLRELRAREPRSAVLVPPKRVSS